MSRTAKEIADELWLFAADEFVCCEERYRDSARYFDPNYEQRLTAFIAGELYDLRARVGEVIKRLATEQAAREAAEEAEEREDA